MRSLLLAALLAGPAAAADYPIRYARVSSAQRDEIRNEFLRRNGPEWSVMIDEFGFVSAAEDSDPSWISQNPADENTVTVEELKTVAAFLRRNAGVFGIDEPEDLHLVPQQGRYWGVQLISDRNYYGFDVDSNKRLAMLNGWENQIEVMKSRHGRSGRRSMLEIQGHFWPKPRLPARPALSESTVAARFVGQERRHTEQHGKPACDPPPPCEFKDEPPREIVVKIRREDLKISLVPHLFRKTAADALELRLAYVVQIGVPGGGMEIVDAMTGEDLPRR